MSTIAAISSPIGAGGIGIVRVSGEDALAIADAVFIFAHKNAQKSGDSSCENLQDRIDEEKRKRTSRGMETALYEFRHVRCG